MTRAVPADDAAFAHARAAWPGIDVTRAAFDAWLDARGVKPGAEVHADELYLVCACAGGDSAAIAAFEQAYFRHLAPAVARFQLSVDDLLQELRVRLFVGTSQTGPKIAEYSGRGGLERWVRAAAVRLALNTTRTRKNQPHATLSDDDFLSGGDVALQHMKEAYRAEFKRALSETLGTLDSELQMYLRMYYLDGLTLAELAGLFGVSEPTASRRVAKAREQVLEGTRAHLGARLGLGAEELDSIMRLIQSRLSVTLGQP